MKKVFCILCCVSLLSTLCSCKKYENEKITSSDGYINESSSLSIITTITESEVQTLPNENLQTNSSEESSPPQDESNVEENSQENTVDNIQTEIEVEQQNQNNNSIGSFIYTVNDPDNLRGLSTERIGYYFGVAADGKPHEQSIINQNTFDGFENVKALALDNKTDKKVMYLTFDNGYEYENITADILDTLKQKNVKAAFFITLSYAKNNKDLVQRMIDEGHIVGNHSSTHPSFPNLTRTQMADEIAELDNYLRTNFSYTSPYFRFPAGEYSENALELVTSIGFKSVFWSVAYADWDTAAQKGEEYAYSTVTSRFHPGAVILLHAVSKDNAQALGRIIDKAISEGYTLSTLDEYFNR